MSQPISCVATVRSGVAEYVAKIEVVPGPLNSEACDLCKKSRAAIEASFRSFNDYRIVDKIDLVLGKEIWSEGDVLVNGMPTEELDICKVFGEFISNEFSRLLEMFSAESIIVSIGSTSHEVKL